MAAQSFSGVSDMSRWVTPNGASASQTAATVAGVVVPLVIATLWRRRLLQHAQGYARLAQAVERLGPVSLAALLATLVLLFGFQGEQIIAGPLIILLLAVPILVQVFFNAGLAYLFDDKAVYIRQPDTVMTRALAVLCPAVAVELGPIGDPRCDERAFDYVKRCLAHDNIPPADAARLDLFETRARIHVPDEVAFSFAGLHEPRPLILTGGLEGVNFHQLSACTEFARTTLPLEEALEVLDPSGHNVTSRFFTLEDDCVRLSRPVYPAMYTTDPVVVRQDCLCYFMKRMRLDDISDAHSETASSAGKPAQGLRD